MARSKQVLWLFFIPFILLACSEPTATREASTRKAWPTSVPATDTIEPTTTAMPTPTLALTYTPFPTATAATETPTAEPAPTGPLVRITSAGANIRSGPGIENAVVAVIAHGETAEVIGTSDDGQWYHVAIPSGGAGWVGSSVAVLLDSPTSDE